MNILCKIFGHRMFFNGSNIFGGSHCARWFCAHTDPGKDWLWPDPPPCKPPRDIHKEKAAEFYGILESEVTDRQREVGKMLNYRRLYGYRFDRLQE